MVEESIPLRLTRRALVYGSDPYAQQDKPKETILNPVSDKDFGSLKLYVVSYTGMSWPRLPPRMVERPLWKHHLGADGRWHEVTTVKRGGKSRLYLDTKRRCLSEDHPR